MGCGSCNTGGGCSPAGCGSPGVCSSSGCNRLNVMDWLSDVDLPNNQSKFNIIEVRFKGSRKGFYRNSKNLELYTGDFVTVESKSGYDVGVVSMLGELVRLQMKKKLVAENDDSVLKIYRKATENDKNKLQEARKKEPEITLRSRQLVYELGLNMKLGDVEYQADKSKITFYYTADNRVDFRELIKSFAKEFHVRVEMRQIGARQEAARIGGLGSCGRELCCSTWLTDFKSVSTSAARYQQLSLNPQKLAGQCGRLKCCLNYELGTYLEALKEFPEEIKILKTKAGTAEMIKMDVFKRQVWYTYQERFENTNFGISIDRVNEILELNKAGTLPEKLENYQIEEELEEVEIDTHQNEGSLTRFDRKRKRKNRNRNRKFNKGKPNQNKNTKPAEANKKTEFSKQTNQNKNQVNKNNSQNKNQVSKAQNSEKKSNQGNKPNQKTNNPKSKNRRKFFKKKKD